MSNESAVPDEGWTQVVEGLERQVLQGSAMTVTRYRFGPGSRFPLHRHPQEQFVYVVSGAIVFRVNDVEHRLAEGATLLIDPSIAHEAVAEKRGAEVLSVVSPARPTTGDAIEILE